MSGNARHDQFAEAAIVVEQVAAHGIVRGELCHGQAVVQRNAHAVERRLRIQPEERGEGQDDVTVVNRSEVAVVRFVARAPFRQVTSRLPRRIGDSGLPAGEGERKLLEGQAGQPLQVAASHELRPWGCLLEVSGIYPQTTVRCVGWKVKPEVQRFPELEEPTRGGP